MELKKLRGVILAGLALIGLALSIFLAKNLIDNKASAVAPARKIIKEALVKTSAVNFKRTEEQYALGTITAIEFRQAQLNLLNAETSSNAAKYNAKLAEYALLQLSGQLLNTDF